MERVTGALISNDEVRFASRRELEQDGVWKEAIRMAPDVPDNTLDEGQVQHLLRRKQGEWVRWIGPIDMVSKNAHWLPITVDRGTETVVGLPDAWLPRMRATILNEAPSGTKSLREDERAGGWRSGAPGRDRMPLGEGDPEAPRSALPGWPATVSEDDFYFTAHEHERLIAAALEEARNSIFVASAFASAGKLEFLSPKIEGALGRGVNVDLLWGYASDGTEDTQALVAGLRKLAYGAKRDGKGILRFNQVPSGSHGKLLLWDGTVGFTACVGSYNWLSALIGQAETSPLSNVTIRTSEPAVVSALARCAAAFWHGVESELTSSTGDRWRRIAAELDKAASLADPSPANARVRLILDREHEALLSEWMGAAQVRLLVASHKLGVVSEIRLMNADVRRPSHFVFDVFYGDSGEDEDRVARITDFVRESGGLLKHVPDLHAKVVISDLSVCVTSYNFLSADPFGTAKNARELGLVIDGGEPADWLWARLHEM
jgi:hypothetical protein